MPSLTDIPVFLRGPTNHFQFVRWLGRQILPLHAKRELAALWAADSGQHLTKQDWTIITNKHTTWDASSS